MVDGINHAYALDHRYRVSNSGAQVLPPAAGMMRPMVMPMLGPPSSAKDRRGAPMRFGDLVVTAIEVNHDPADPAYGYRFDYRGRSVTISGDTNFHPPLAMAARGSDVLVHEAQSQHLVDLVGQAAMDSGRARVSRMMGDIHHYHTGPVDAARIANAAGARLLVFNHLNPPPTNWLLRRMFYSGVGDVRVGDWIEGEDGTLITLPIGTRNVQVSTLPR